MIFAPNTIVLQLIALLEENLPLQMQLLDLDNNRENINELLKLFHLIMQYRRNDPSVKQEMILNSVSV